jgi:hypothetical protein
MYVEIYSAAEACYKQICFVLFCNVWEFEVKHLLKSQQPSYMLGRSPRIQHFSSVSTGVILKLYVWLDTFTNKSI